MKDSWTTMGAALVVLTTLLATTACTSVSNSSARTVPSCAQLLAGTIAYERSGTGDIDSTMQALSGRCSNEYEIAVDYLSNSTDSAFSIDSCDELIGFGVRKEAVALLEQDGRCSFGSGDVSVAPEWPENGLGWDHASEHTGTVQRVCGPLMSVRNTEDGAFVNIGRDYPSADRFTFIFWDLQLNPIEAGATVCGSGEIYLYDGVVAQMEMWDPGALEIWR